MKRASNWMIYGANGYTGELIARKAVSLGLKPILAGRNAEKITRLAHELTLENRIFSLVGEHTIMERIEDCSLVLHCAGPFAETAEPMVKACLATSTHYLDITGEIPVYQLLHLKHQEAVKAGIMLLPGVGFDIVPTDCLALMLKERMPDALYLALSFLGLGGVSAGTLKSALGQLPYGSKIRRNGELVSVPHLSLSRTVHYKGRDFRMYSIPWGDVYTAYLTTGIPNIEVYTYFSESQANMMSLITPLSMLLRIEPVLKAAQWLAGMTQSGPSEETRQKERAIIWGEVQNSSGKKILARLETPEAYQLTVETALGAVQKVLRGSYQAGFQTPAKVFGSQFIMEIPGVSLFWE
ncbi:MAG: saccharopine dehydrogenase NADP-binding domain-containing protein [Leptospiraceae bacterium]|nr:saccharopine dehydrogenase NADP-binding domain-containing protein [Leptospiraceae bacterium]MDW8306555.1 saccharopine dehydrogenase NADP-binding domain-containing protein [Leptospiraceae bacterium]